MAAWSRGLCRLPTQPPVQLTTPVASCCFLPRGNTSVLTKRPQSGSRRWLELVSGRGKKEETDVKKKRKKRASPAFPSTPGTSTTCYRNHSVKLSKLLSPTQTTGDAWTLLTTASFSASHTALFCYPNRAFLHANSYPSTFNTAPCILCLPQMCSCHCLSFLKPLSSQNKLIATVYVGILKLKNELLSYICSTYV